MPLICTLRNLQASLLICIASSSAAVFAENKTAAEKLWQPLSKEELLQRGLASYCGGYYPTPVSDLSSDAFLEADNAEFALGSHVSLKGNVILQNGGHQVTAQNAEYDIEKQQLQLSNNIELRSDNVFITSEYADMGVDANSGNFNNTSYLIVDQHLRGKAERIHRSGERSLTIENGFYTQCAPNDRTWYISTRSLELNIEEGYGVARGAKVNLWDKPVIYIPYMPFPLGDTRKSGLLWPSISTASDASGIDLALPLYWNIAPQADATFTPRNIGSRAAGIEAETRYLHKLSTLSVSGGYFTDNQLNEDRWLFGFNEQGKIGDHLHHRISISRVSDTDYFDDFNTVALDIRRRTHLQQMAALSYWGEHQFAELSIQQYQTIEEGVRTPFKALPKFHWQLLERESHGKIAVTGLVDYGHFDNKDSTRAEGQRTFYEAGIALPYNWQAGFIKTSAKVKGLEYYAANNSVDVSNHNEVFSLDTGLNFERWDNGKKMTLQPRMYYLYAKGIDQQRNPLFDTTLATDTVERRFKDSQYIGHDRLDDANDLTLGLSAKWFDKNAREILGAAVAQTFLFSDKTTDLEELRSSDTAASDIVTSIYWRGIKHLNVETHMVVDKNLSDFVNGHARALYNNDDGVLFGISQVYNSSETLLEKRHQTEVSAALPINDQWTIYGQLHYDYNRKQKVQQTFGLAREDCCWRLRLVAQESIEASGLQGETDTSFHLQFELKGLGGTGSSAVKVLQDAIYGFRNDEQ